MTARDLRARRAGAAVALVAMLVGLAALPPASASTAGAEQVTRADRTIDVVAFNVLAPIWAGPDFYPADLDPSSLHAGFRRARVTAFLEQQAATAEIVALQEVQASEYRHLAKALGPEFVGVMSHNAPSFWSSWLTTEPWQPNGTALFIRSAAFGPPRFALLEQSTGNSVAWVTVRHLATGQRFRAASIHLDSDRQPNRVRELKALLSAWEPARPGTTDVIAGDVNDDTLRGPTSRVFNKSGFVDVLAAVGNREATHPWPGDPWSGGYESPRWSILDHVLVRNARPLSGDVVDSGTLALDGLVPRIEANLDAVGSDHFPVLGAVRLPVRR